jgi:hypothetical protein
VAKRLGLFDVWKVPESQKYANERGLFRESLNSIENMSRPLINYQINKNMTK